LGTLFGRNTTTLEVFRCAVDKFWSRFKSFQPAMKRLAIRERSLVANVFLLPILYYLCQFYIMPYYQMVLPIATALHRCIVPYNGGGFAYAHLITPGRRNFGLSVPLKDLWAVNLTLLGAHFDLDRSSGHAEVNLGTYQRVIKHGYLDSSMRPDEHAAHAAFVFLHDYAPRSHGGQLIDLGALPGQDKPARRRSWFYRVLATEGYFLPRSAKAYGTSLPSKVGKLLKIPADSVLASHILAHARAISSRLSPAKWDFQIRLVFNALPFLDRRSKYGAAPSDHLCFLCGKGKDSVSHVFNDCQVVQEARAMVSARTECWLPDGLSSAILAFPPTSSSVRAPLMITFNWSVWTLRLRFFSTLLTPPDARSSASRIAEHTLSCLLPRDPTSRIEKEVAAFASQPPPEAISAFTDGSEITGGWAGAGIWISFPDGTTVSRAIPLGRRDNNEAEMCALSETFILLLGNIRAYPTRAPILIFSDSACCLGYLLHGWSPPCSQTVARECRRRYNRLRIKAKTLRLYWIRGHSGITGNERADKQAGLGAREAKAAMGYG
jgi:ribonuclease HI